MPEIKVKCPAKVNLTLEILNKREDGFHNIQSVMQTINLFDILTISIEKSESFEIKLSGTSNEIPYDEKNLVFKAAKLFMESLNPSPFAVWGKCSSTLCSDPSPLVGEGGWKPDEGFKKILDERAKVLRNKSTTPEQILWYYLRDRRFNNLKFRRQVPIETYIADFVCFEKRLIIELDGSQHLENNNLKHDKKRDEFLKGQDFKILRFYNNDIFNNTESVLQSIFENTKEETPHPQPLSRKGRGENSLSDSTFTPDSKGRGENAPKTFSISIHIEKNIPIAAGLAGGSTDAAGTLWGLNEILDRPLSKEELHELCAQLGSDLNFCLEGGCQLTTGRGEILEKLNFCEFNLSLIKPKDLGISAKEAYTKFSQLEKKPNLNMTTKLVEALKSSNCKAKDYLHNDLEYAVINDYPQLKQIKNAYPKSIMSGSGSTFFILEQNFNDFDENFWIKQNLKSIPFGVCKEI